MEYVPEPSGAAPGSTVSANVIYASVNTSPLRLDKNFGFRYLARGLTPGSVRLYYDNHHRLADDVAFLQPRGDEANSVVMVVCGQSSGYVEAVAYHRSSSGSFQVKQVSFDIMVLRRAPANVSVRPTPDD
jgi:hypothetical protein